MPSLFLASGVVAANPGVTPNSNGIPGISLLQSIAGGILTAGFIACVAGLVIASVCWALGSHQGNARLAISGRTGVLVSVAAAVLVGGADALVTFFSNAGAQL
jgi:Family of unknown function (DUF6112)